MKTLKEYPAGHSVDTEWFAMDKEGHIAMFGSGEEGWLPAEYDTDTHWGDIIGDALQMNSTPLFDGIRRIILPENTISFIKNEMERQSIFSYEEHWSDGRIVHHTPGECTSLNRRTIELCDGCNITDLSIWKERLNPKETLVYQFSEDSTLYMAVSLEFPTNVLNEDITSGRIIGETYFNEEDFYFYYYPKDDFALDAEMIEEGYWTKKGCPPIAFKLPKGFHNMKTLDVSFTESKELNLDELTGMYVLDLECGTDDVDHFAWPYYYGYQKSDLEENLFVAIERMRSRTVWCLLDRYRIRPDVFSKSRGETAMELARAQYEKNKDEKWDNWPNHYSSYRILKMLQLKEKQLKQKENDHA